MMVLKINDRYKHLSDEIGIMRQNHQYQLNQIKTTLFNEKQILKYFKLKCYIILFSMI